MAPTIFSWRPKAIRIGRKTPVIIESQNISNNSNSTGIMPIIDPVSVALPPSTINNNTDYIHELNSLSNNDNNIPENYSQRIQRVRFSDG